MREREAKERETHVEKRFIGSIILGLGNLLVVGDEEGRDLGIAIRACELQHDGPGAVIPVVVVEDDLNNGLALLRGQDHLKGNEKEEEEELEEEKKEEGKKRKKKKWREKKKRKTNLGVLNRLEVEAINGILAGVVNCGAKLQPRI